MFGSKSGKGATGSLKPGAPMPPISLSGLDDQPIGFNDGKWGVLVVYRGAHCPLCRGFLTALESLRQEYSAANIDLIVVSADPKDRARAFTADIGYGGQVAYGLSVKDMEALGVYISEPVDASEAPGPFAEPALFCFNAEGNLHVLEKSNSPIVRPDMSALLGGLTYLRDNAAPVRGTGAR
jgi:peroxiredoxin